MHIPKALLGILLVPGLMFPITAQAADLVILVDTGTEMPMARFERYQLVAGIHRDIGVALARGMGRTPRFMSLPRKRIVRALAAGNADVLCSYVPEWLDGSFHWSQPFIPIVELLLADRSVARPHSVADVAGQPVGTVLGYAHPELEAILGKDFIRDDGSTAEANLRKLAAGRVKYAVTVKTTLDYRLKLGDPVLHLHPPLVVKSYMGQCAVSPTGRVSLAEVDRAISRMVSNRTVAAVVARYQ